MSPRSRFISWGLPYRASNFPPMNVCASQVIRFGPPAKRLRSTSIRPLLFCLWIASITSLCCSRNQIPAGHDSGIEVASDSSSKPIAATASSTISPSFSVVPSACAPPPCSSIDAEPPSAPLTLLSEQGPIPAANAQRILHIGDSMVPLVGNYLRSVFTQSKRRYEIISIPSSSTLSWAQEHGLRDAVYRYDPQVILISLGSNELFDPIRIAEQRPFGKSSPKHADVPACGSDLPLGKKTKGSCKYSVRTWVIADTSTRPS